MAHPSTLYRFRIELSDVDRGVYRPLDFRVAMHPSESHAYLVTRVLAFALNASDGLAFTPAGLSDPDAPCLSEVDGNQAIQLWIEIGNPSARKLHRASKAAQAVKVYTYKNPELLLKELASAQIYQMERIQIHSFDPNFLDRLAQALKRDNSWGLVRTDGTLMVSVDGKSEQGELFTHPFPGAE